MADYWDTSCLLKLYCPESDSGDFKARVHESKTHLVSSSLAKSELYFAFQHKTLRGETSAALDAQSLYELFEKDIHLV